MHTVLDSRVFSGEFVWNLVPPPNSDACDVDTHRVLWTLGGQISKAFIFLHLAPSVQDSVCLLATSCHGDAKVFLKKKALKFFKGKAVYFTEKKKNVWFSLDIRILRLMELTVFFWLAAYVLMLLLRLLLLFIPMDFCLNNLNCIYISYGRELIFQKERLILVTSLNMQRCRKYLFYCFLLYALLFYIFFILEV